MYVIKWWNKSLSNKLLLFAPGVGYINHDLERLQLDEDKIIVGWNKEDTKVKMEKIWPILHQLLPRTRVLLFNMDINNHGLGVDTQHEINSQFIKNVYKNWLWVTYAIDNRRLVYRNAIKIDA